jgi:hypothetical protein
MSQNVRAGGAASRPTCMAMSQNVRAGVAASRPTCMAMSQNIAGRCSFSSEVVRSGSGAGAQMPLPACAWPRGGRAGRLDARPDCGRPLPGRCSGRGRAFRKLWFAVLAAWRRRAAAAPLGKRGRLNAWQASCRQRQRASGRLAAVGQTHTPAWATHFGYRSPLTSPCSYVLGVKGRAPHSLASAGCGHPRDPLAFPVVVRGLCELKLI